MGWSAIRSLVVGRLQSGACLQVAIRRSLAGWCLQLGLEGYCPFVRASIAPRSLVFPLDFRGRDGGRRTQS